MEPTDEPEQATTVYSTAAGSHKTARAIDRSAALLGYESSHQRPPDGLPVEFVDFPFRSESATFEDHLAAVREEQPRLAVAPDLDDSRDPEAVYQQADRLLEHADVVVVITKRADTHPEDVPDRFRVGVPLQGDDAAGEQAGLDGEVLADGGSFAGTLAWRVADYRQAGPVHLLGGSPVVHREVAKYLDVASVDTSTPERAAKYGDYWTPNGWANAGQGADLYDTIRSSLDHMVAFWRERAGLDAPDPRPPKHDEPASSQTATVYDPTDALGYGRPAAPADDDGDLWSQRDHLEEATPGLSIEDAVERGLVAVEDAEEYRHEQQQREQAAIEAIKTSATPARADGGQEVEDPHTMSENETHPTLKGMDATLRGDRLHVEADTGNKQWVAVLNGTDPKYGYDRDFIAYQKPKTSDRADGSTSLDPGDVIESVRYTHSGKNDSRLYHIFTGDGLEEIEKVEVDEALEQPYDAISEFQDDENGDQNDADSGGEWADAVAYLREHYGDDYQDRIEFSSDIGEFADEHEIPRSRHFGDEGVTQPLLRYQEVPPADAYDQIENRAGENDAQDIRAALVAFAEADAARSDEDGDEQDDEAGGEVVVGQSSLSVPAAWDGWERLVFVDQNGGVRDDQEGDHAVYVSEDGDVGLIVEGTRASNKWGLTAIDYSPALPQDTTDPIVYLYGPGGHDGDSDREKVTHGNDVSMLGTSLDDYLMTASEVRETFTDEDQEDEADGGVYDPAGEEFAPEKQGTLDSGVEAEETAEERQVTLTGGDPEEDKALPADWRADGSMDGTTRTSTWTAGPLSVTVVGSPPGPYGVVLSDKSGHQFDVASRIDDGDVAAEVAERFTDAVGPQNVSFRTDDAVLPEAAAEAKEAISEASEGGLDQFTGDEPRILEDVDQARIEENAESGDYDAALRSGGVDTATIQALKDAGLDSPAAFVAHSGPFTGVDGVGETMNERLGSVQQAMQQADLDDPDDGLPADLDPEEYEGDYKNQRMENAHYWAAELLGWMKNGPNAGLRGTYYVDIIGGTPVLVVDGDEWSESNVQAIKDGLRDAGFPDPLRVREVSDGEMRLFISDPSDDRLPAGYHPDWREFEATGGDGGDAEARYAEDQLDTWDTPNPNTTDDQDDGPGVANSDEVTVDLSAWDASTTRTALNRLANRSDGESAREMAETFGRYTEDGGTVEVRADVAQSALDALVSYSEHMEPGLLSIMGKNDDDLVRVESAVEAFEAVEGIEASDQMAREALAAKARTSETSAEREGYVEEMMRDLEGTGVSMTDHETKEGYDGSSYETMGDDEFIHYDDVDRPERREEEKDLLSEALEAQDAEAAPGIEDPTEERPYVLELKPETMREFGGNVLGLLRKDYGQRAEYLREQDVHREDISELVKRTKHARDRAESWASLPLSEAEMQTAWAATSYYADQQGNTSSLSRIEAALADAETAAEENETQGTREETNADSDESEAETEAGTDDDTDDDPSEPQGRGERVEFNRLDAANEWRDELADADLHPDDTRRTKTITLAPDASEQVVEDTEDAALVTFADEQPEYGQEQLTDEERETLEQRDGWTWGSNGFEAMSAKAALTAEGAADWLNYYEKGEGVEGSLANLEAGKQATAETGAANAVDKTRDESEMTRGEAAEAVEKAEGKACSRAVEGCESGYQEACQQLIEDCGYSEAEVADLQAGIEEMGEDPADVLGGGPVYQPTEDTDDDQEPAEAFADYARAADPGPEPEVSDEELAALAPKQPSAEDYRPEVLERQGIETGDGFEFEPLPDGARRVVAKAWKGYRVSRVEATDAMEQAETYAETINGVRMANGLRPMEFQELEGLAESAHVPEDPSQEYATEDGEKRSLLEAMKQGLDVTGGDVYDPTEDV